MAGRRDPPHEPGRTASPGRGTRRLPGLSLLLPAALLATSCVALHRGGLYPTGRDQVFVAYFFNETFYRDVEFDLADQIVSEILSRPGLRLSSKDDAEVVLTGRVLDIQQRVLSENAQLIPTSENTSVTVEVRIEDARSGEVLQRLKLTGRGEFVQAQGQTVEVGRRTALQFLARDIVRVLEEDF